MAEGYVVGAARVRDFVAPLGSTCPRALAARQDLTQPSNPPPADAGRTAPGPTINTARFGRLATQFVDAASDAVEAPVNAEGVGGEDALDG